jgi:hypothetical protein
LIYSQIECEPWMAIDDLVEWLVGSHTDARRKDWLTVRVHHYLYRHEYMVEWYGRS